MTDIISQNSGPTPTIGSANRISTTIGNGGAHRFSDLAIALIKFCVQDGDNASKEISDRLTTMQAQVNGAISLLGSDDHAIAIGGKLNDLSSEIMNTVIALQFFDRISQRMEHAVESVEAISDAASEKSKTLEQRFTMDDERILYDALLEGCSVEEALDKANQRLNDTIESNGTDIELF